METDLRGCCWQQRGRSMALQLPCLSGRQPAQALHLRKLVWVQMLLAAEFGHWDQEPP